VTRILLEICKRALPPVIAFELAESTVALTAQDAAEASGGVIVIYVEFAVT
jgi:hypothetical protein